MKAPRYACLIRIQSAAGSIRTQLIDKESFSFGRSAEADVLAPFQSVSRVHLIARLRDGRVSVEDQGSSNGTLLDGAPLAAKAEVELTPGAKFKLGEAAEIYSIEAIEIPAEMMDLDQARATLNSAAAEVLEKARQDARAEAAVELKTLIEAGRAQAQTVRIEAEKEAARIVAEGRGALGGLKVEAQREADAILAEATARGAQAVEKAQDEADRVLREAQRKAAAAIAEAEGALETALLEARAAASSIRVDAQREADALRAKALQRAADVSREAEEEAARVTRAAREKALAFAAAESGRPTAVPFATAVGSSEVAFGSASASVSATAPESGRARFASSAPSANPAPKPVVSLAPPPPPNDEITADIVLEPAVVGPASEPVAASVGAPTPAPPAPAPVVIALDEVAPGRGLRFPKWLLIPIVGLALALGAWLLGNARGKSGADARVESGADARVESGADARPAAPIAHDAFASAQTDEFHSTYLENVLFLKGYVDAKARPETQQKWAAQLTSFFEQDPKVNPAAAREFMAVEAELVPKLNEMKAALTNGARDEGIAKMQQVEQDAHRRLVAIAGSEFALGKIRDLERALVASSQK